MAKLLNDSREERLITVELTERDFITILSAMGTSNIEDLRKFCLANNVDMEKMHNFYDSEELFVSLYKVLKSE